MARLSREAEHNLTDLTAVAEARLREFRVLRNAKEYAGAVYLGRYVLEVLLKCAICKRLGKDELPTIFHSHDLNVLLYYSGLEEPLKQDALRFSSFEDVISGPDVDGLRYRNPTQLTEQDCDNWNTWLNDPDRGLVPWLREKLK